MSSIEIPLPSSMSAPSTAHQAPAAALRNTSSVRQGHGRDGDAGQDQDKALDAYIQEIHQLYAISQRDKAKVQSLVEATLKPTTKAFIQKFRSRGASRRPPNSHRDGFALWLAASLDRNHIDFCLDSIFSTTRRHGKEYTNLYSQIVSLATDRNNTLIKSDLDLFLFFGKAIAISLRALRPLRKALAEMAKADDDDDEPFLSVYHAVKEIRAARLADEALKTKRDAPQPHPFSGAVLFPEIALEYSEGPFIPSDFNALVEQLQQQREEGEEEEEQGQLAEARSEEGEEPVGEGEPEEGRAEGEEPEEEEPEEVELGRDRAQHLDDPYSFVSPRLSPMPVRSATLSTSADPKDKLQAVRHDSASRPPPLTKGGTGKPSKVLTDTPAGDKAQKEGREQEREENEEDEDADVSRHFNLNSPIVASPVVGSAVLGAPRATANSGDRDADDDDDDDDDNDGTRAANTTFNPPFSSPAAGPAVPASSAALSSRRIAPLPQRSLGRSLTSPRPSPRPWPSTDPTPTPTLSRGQGPPFSYTDYLVDWGSLVSTAHDMACLAPGRWLNDQVINTMLRRLESPTPETPDSIAVVDPLTLKEVTKLGSSLIKSPPSRRIARLRQFGTLLIPVNVSQIHWALFVWRRDARVLEWYDSIQCKPTSSQGKTEKFLRWLYQGTDLDLGGPGDNQKKISIVTRECPPQRNSYDCGLHVVANAQMVARGVTRTDAHLSASSSDPNADPDASSRRRRALLTAEYLTSPLHSPIALELFFFNSTTYNKQQHFNAFVRKVHVARSFQKDISELAGAPLSQPRKTRSSRRRDITADHVGKEITRQWNQARVVAAGHLLAELQANHSRVVVDGAKVHQETRKRPGQQFEEEVTAKRVKVGEMVAGYLAEEAEDPRRLAAVTESRKHMTVNEAIQKGLHNSLDAICAEIAKHQALMKASGELEHQQDSDHQRGSEQKILEARTKLIVSFGQIRAASKWFHNARVAEKKYAEELEAEEGGD